MSVDPQCSRCARLVEYRKQVKALYPDYHCAPVPAVGDTEATLLIVGLAPGLHGANASGIPFTGDASGDFLFKALYKHGLASANHQPARQCRITNAVKCLPPKNRPNTSEIVRCNGYLLREIESLRQPGVILALGVLAHDAIIRALDLKRSAWPFTHAAIHQISQQLTLIDSYHCSRYNTQTGRLTESAFDTVMAKIINLVNQ